MSKTKKELGQFFTTNYSYIFQNIEIPNNIEKIIEPFTGNGDLVKFIEESKNNYEIECYDIDPKKDFIKKRDTLLNPPEYKNKYIVSNPPYLARNKTDNKELFNKYDCNDLYKCFLKEICLQTCLGGILIIPLNFFSSIRKNDIELRRLFLSIFTILKLSIFEEQVFDDTSYTVCSFQFELKKSNLEFPITIYPSKIIIQTNLNEENNFMIGGSIYKLKYNKYKITRATSKNKESDYLSNILIKCIDDNKKSKIKWSIVDKKDIYIDETPNLSSRTYATLLIEPKIDEQKQKELVKRCNEYLEDYRKKYQSLFLCNYRESKDIARKRISFDLVYDICGFILEDL